MEIVYNIEAFHESLHFTKGDTINMSFSVQKNAVDYNMTGMQIDVHVKRYDGSLVKTMTSSGGTPEIIIAGNVFTIYCAGFSTIGIYKYDVQITNGTEILTIGSGILQVVKEYTT
jgi:hypothetical protein